jgi:hypothetical protein
LNRRRQPFQTLFNLNLLLPTGLRETAKYLQIRDGAIMGWNHGLSFFGKKHCALHSDVGRAAELGSRGGRRRTVFSPEQLIRFPHPRIRREANE